MTDEDIALSKEIEDKMHEFMRQTGKHPNILLLDVFSAYRARRVCAELCTNSRYAYIGDDMSTNGMRVRQLSTRKHTVIVAWDGD